MSSPGGIEAARVRVRVLPDTSAFARSLERYLQRIERRVRVDLPTSLDTTGADADLRELRARIAKASATVDVEADTAGVATQIERVARDRTAHVRVEVDRGALARAASGLRDMNGILAGLSPARIGLVTAALAQTAYAAGSLTAAVLPAAGALGLIPAAGFAGAAAIATLAIGVQGVGDALKAAAEGDAQKLAEAMKGLAPAAQETVKAVKSLTPAWRAMQQAVQQQLFTGLAESIRGLGQTYLPLMRRELGGIASLLNSGARATSGALLDPGIVASLSRALGEVRASLAYLQQAGADTVRALAPIVEVGATFLPGFADAAGDAAAAFADFIGSAAQTGQLKGWISAGLSALGDLAQIAGNAAGAVLAIAQAAQSVGGGSLSAILEVVRGLNGALSSAAGQEALGQIFGGAAAGVAALSTAFAPLGEVFRALAPVVGTIATQVGGVLAAAVKAIAPVIVSLAPYIGEVSEALGVGLVYAIDQLAPLLADMARVLSENRPLVYALGAAVAYAVGPIGLAAAAIAGAVLVFREWGPQIQAVAAQIGTALAPVFSAFADAARELWPLLQGLGDALGGWADTVLPIVAQVAAVFVEQWPQIRSTVASVFQSIVSIIGSAISIVTTQIRVWTTVIGALWRNGFGTMITGVVRGALTTVLAVVKGAFNVVAGLFKTIASLMKGDWSGAWDGIKQTVSGAVGAVVGIVRGMGQQASAALGGVTRSILDSVSGWGKLLLNAGKALIQGLIDGITSRIRDVTSAVSGIASKIKGFFPGSPVKEGPLTSWNRGGAGRRLVGLLVDGMDDTRGVEAAAQRMAARVSAGFTPVRPNVPALAYGAPVGGGAGVQVAFTGPIYARDDEAVMREASARTARALTLAGVL